MAKTAKKKAENTKTAIDAVQVSFNVLYDLWFPISALPIPPKALPAITGISQQVQTAFWTGLPKGNKTLLDMITTLAYPQKLPFYQALKDSTNPAIRKMITNPLGFGGLTRDQATQVMSFFFIGTAGPVSTLYAMVLREAFLSVIWSLPLAVPLTGIQQPTTFISNPVVYSQLHYPALPPSWLNYDANAKVIKPKSGVIDYLIIGSGPGGATMAHELQ